MKKLYFVFEYCGGGELYEVIRKTGGMNEKEAAIAFMQILLAVNYMHGNNICHRDIKAENCLYLTGEANSTLKLIDFGLAVEYIDPSIFHSNI